ncbi:hypothetical protein ABTN43_19095, partial [Acinetobacter baumannii]
IFQRKGPDGQPDLLLGANTVDPDGPFGKEGMTFHDVLDMVNPLQQLPIIGPIYRAVTGETITPGARMMGSMLYGGPIGLAGAFLDGAVAQAT